MVTKSWKIDTYLTDDRQHIFFIRKRDLPVVDRNVFGCLFIFCAPVFPSLCFYMDGTECAIAFTGTTLNTNGIINRKGLFDLA